MPVNTHQNFHTQIRATSETIFETFGVTWEEAARLANDHTLAVQRFLSTRSPQAKVFERPGVVGCLSGIKVPFLNLSLDASYPADIGEQELLAEINALRNFYRGHNMQNCWYWLMSPFATPKYFPKLLLEQSFGREEYLLPCLMTSLKDTSNWPSIPGNLAIWAARDIEDLKIASHIRRTAFQEGNEAISYFEDMADSWLANENVRMFLGCVKPNKIPVAMGMFIVANNVPGIYVMATLPEWEHQGLGRAIIARVLQEAIERGYDKAVLTAGARAYSLYRKFGFQHLFEYLMLTSDE